MKTARKTKAELAEAFAAELTMLGQNLRRARNARGLTQADLHMRSGVGIGSISELERGVGNPTIDTIGKLAEAVGCEPSALLTPGFSVAK